MRHSSRARDVIPRPRVSRRPPRPAARWRRCPPAETPPRHKTRAAIGRLLGQSARQTRSRDHARLLSNNQQAGLPSRAVGRALAVDWCLGPSIIAAQRGSGRRLVLGAVNQRRRARAGCDAEEPRARPGGGCGGRVVPAPQVGIAVRAALCRCLRPCRLRGSCTE